MKIRQSIRRAFSSRRPIVVPASDAEQLEKVRRFILDALGDDKPAVELVKSLPPENAQVAVDEIWKSLRPSLIPPDETEDRRTRLSHHNKLLRLCVSLTMQYDVLPKQIHLSHVKVQDVHIRGAGGFGDVYLGTYEHRDVALKALRLSMSMSEKKKKETKRDLRREVMLWATLEHPHVLPLLGISKQAFGAQDRTCIVLPWKPGGNIRDYILNLQSMGLLLTEPDFSCHVNTWLFQIASGLAYLHREGIVHGDLHGGNILVAENDHIQLTDFGMSVIGDGTPYDYHSKHGGGATNWLAPELMREDGPSRPTYSSDVYSFAMVCIELYSGDRPFSEYARPEPVITRVLQGIRPDRPTAPSGEPMSQELWTLIRQCWASTPTERPSSKQVHENLGNIVSSQSYEQEGLQRMEFIASFPVDPSDDIQHIALLRDRLVVVSPVAVTIQSLPIGKVLATLRHPVGLQIDSVIVREDMVLTLASDNAIRIWDPSAGQCVHTIRSARYRLSHLTLIEPTVVVTRKDGRFKKELYPKHTLFAVTKGQTRLILDKSPDAIPIPTPYDFTSALTVLDLPELAPNLNQARPLEWELDEHPNHHCTLTCDTQARVECVAAHGKLVATGGDDRDVRIWNIAKERLEWKLSGLTSKVVAIALNAQRSIICAGSIYGSICIWSLTTGQCLHLIEPDRKAPPEYWGGNASLHYSPSYYAFSNNQKYHFSQVCRWNTGEKDRSFILRGTKEKIEDFSVDASKVVAVSVGSMKMVSVETGAIVQELPLRRDIMPHKVVANERYCAVIARSQSYDEAQRAFVWAFSGGHVEGSLNGHGNHLFP